MAENSLPTDLSSDKFRDILRKECEQEVEILEVQTNAGSTKGDHHLSEINRVKVKYLVKGVENVKSFIFKDVTKSINDFVETVKGIEKENSWYTEIQPHITKLGVNFGAICYEVHRDWLLVEDLCPYGYKIADRTCFLDLDHCKKAVEALAKFHATTHHLLMSNNIPDVAMQQTQFTAGNDTEIYQNFKNFDLIADNLSECGGEKYGSAIKELKPKAWEKLLHCLNNNYGFKSLVHGDYWTTNILFNYDKNDRVCDAKIIDFQLINASNPVSDIHFFICTSMRPEVRDNHLSDVLQVYLKTLNSTLKEIGSTTQLSQEIFQRMFEEGYFIGLFVSLTFLPIPLCDTDSPLEFNPPSTWTEEEKKKYNPFAKVYKQIRYRKRLLSLLEFYRQKNIL